MHVVNIDGPLNYMENNWKFVENGNFTEVIFDIDFEIKNKFLNILMTKSFNTDSKKLQMLFKKGQRHYNLLLLIEEFIIPKATLTVDF